MNILFITADQWRAECLSVLQHPFVKTPNLDALASEGTLFKNHYAQATPCSPSRTSLHTGMYLQNHRCVNNGSPVDAGLTNWALEMNKIGISPSLFGYTDTGADPRGMDSLDPRLQHYSEPLPGVGDYTPVYQEVIQDWVEYLRSKNYSIPDKLWDLYGDTIEGLDWADGGEMPLPLAIAAEDHETCYMVDRCIDWIHQQSNDWVSHLSLLRPHPPFAVPAPYNEIYDPALFDEPLRRGSREDESGQHPFLEFLLNNEKFKAPESLKQSQQDKANYFGLMTEVDNNLGRLFGYLKDSGQWDDTLIIFTSDHGEQAGDHWLQSKQGFFNQSYHVPLIVRDPRQLADKTRGKILEGFTENVDIMPTMLEWYEIAIPGQCDGFSLRKIIENGEFPQGWRTEVHWEYDFRNIRDQTMEQELGLTLHQCNLAVVRDHEFKYVHFPTLSPMLFDLKNDPEEFNNVAEEPEYQSVTAKYAQKMLSWKMNFQFRGLSEISLGEGGPVTRSSPLRTL